VTQVGGGDPVNLTKDSPANDRMPSWSPDGREIAFFSDRGDEWGLYIVAAIGGNPRKALPLPGIANDNWSAPRWSEDGSKLFVSVREAGKNVVLILSVASLEVSRVFLPDHDGNVCWDLSVSADGQRFAYAEGGSGATDITRLWTISTSGGEPVPLTDGRTNVRSPTWSLDGGQVFYVSNRGGSMDLWQQSVTKDGTPVGEPRSLTQGLGIASAAFSRDGTKLAYTRGGRVANVWRVPILADRAATWTDARQVTSEHAEIETLDVSPDGQLLAISSDRRGNKDVWLVPVTGGAMTQLTTDPTPDWSPRWSPDGKEIAFYAYRSGNRDIWVMPAQGGPARQLAAHPGQDWYPSWSPDGREIAFTSVGRSATMLVDAKGGEPRPLFTGTPRAEWFPDGPWRDWLLVLRDGRLHRVARQGGEPLPLPFPRNGRQPALGRLTFDGQSVIFSQGFTGPAAGRTFWKLSLDDGEVFRLTHLEGRRGSTGSFAVDRQSLYFTWREDVGDIWVMSVLSDSNN
jgi:Tol biopolymer transport system component